MPRCNRVIRAIARLFSVLPIGLGLLMACPSYAADTRYGIDAALVYDDNINRGQNGYEKSDTIVTVEGNVSRSILLSHRSGLILRGGLSYDNFFDFGDLSNLSVFGRAAYRFQPNPGYTGTVLEAAVDAAALQFRDSDIRDGYLYAISGAATKRVTDRIKLGAGLRWTERRADTGDVFDMSFNDLWLTADYRTGTMTWYGSVSRIDGDHVITTARGSYPGLNANTYEAFAIDTAYAGAFGSATPWAYRLDATTVAFEVGVNVPLHGSHTLDFSARYFDSDASKSAFTYSGTAVRAMYFYRF